MEKPEAEECQAGHKQRGPDYQFGIFQKFHERGANVAIRLSRISNAIGEILGDKFITRTIWAEAAKGTFCIVIPRARIV